MELELNRTHLTGYESILDTTVFREETQETIVSDSNPDILRLIDTHGSAFLKGKAVSDGRVVLTGTARLTVLYLPDSGTGPCRMEVNIPFSMSVEDSRIKAGCTAAAMPRISSADTRTMNPRKVVTRVEIAADIKVFSVKSQTLCTGATAEKGVLEQLSESHRITCITAVQDKQVSFEDDLTIPVGRPAAEELISGRVLLTCHDRKIIGNKLVLKGEAAVQMLYRPVTGGLDTADFNLPFSQIVEVNAVGEEGKCQAEMALTGAEFVLGADGRTVSASLSMLTQIIVWEERSVELLADAYSTCCQIKADCMNFDYLMAHGEGVGRQSVRELIETGMQMKSVVDSYCSIGRVSQHREGEALQFTTQLAVTALCMTENDEYCAVSRGMEVTCPVEIPEECVCMSGCHCSGLNASPTADGVEVRLQLDFPYRLMKAARAVLVRDLTLEDSSQENTASKPSVVLRVTEEGERLWDVAKRYGTTVGDIVKANDLENEQPDGGTLLLIPRKR